jgi:hypothetical protein
MACTSGRGARGDSRTRRKLPNQTYHHQRRRRLTASHCGLFLLVKVVNLYARVVPRFCTEESIINSAPDIKFENFVITTSALRLGCPAKPIQLPTAADRFNSSLTERRSAQQCSETIATVEWTK